MRESRDHICGGFSHVTHRGNNKQDIYRDVRDLLAYLEILRDGLVKFGHRVHAYCLMGNHAHLLIEVDQAPLWKIMHNLTMRYAKWFNRRHRRIGHLFQKRYGNKPVGDDSYLLAVVRYIHLNPVRAGIVVDPRDFLWSGHRTYVGLDENSWATTDRVLGVFSDDREEARMRYSRFVEQKLREDLSKRNGKTPFREEESVRPPKPEWVSPGPGREPPEHLRAKLNAIVARVAAEYGIEVSALAGGRCSLPGREARAVITCAYLQLPGSRHHHLAWRFGVSRSAVSRAWSGFRRRLLDDGTLAGRLFRVQLALRETLRADVPDRS